jgi:membrane-bound lytic murein transglycosylase A
LEFINLNRRYIFFNADNGLPKGSNGLELTPRHSVAVDTTLIPYGAVGLVSTSRPGKVQGSTTYFSTLVLPQDSGDAIKLNHIDMYFGADPYAEEAATSMKSPGNFFIGVPK